jgi:hypothetical protein
VERVGGARLAGDDDSSRQAPDRVNAGLGWSIGPTSRQFGRRLRKIRESVRGPGATRRRWIGRGALIRNAFIVHAVPRSGLLVREICVDIAMATSLV